MNKALILLVLALFCALSFAQHSSFRLPRTVVALDEVEDNNLAKLKLNPNFGISGASSHGGISWSANGGVTGNLGNHGATWNLGGKVSHSPGGRPGWGVGGGIRIPF